MLEHLEETETRDWHAGNACEKSVISDATSALMAYLDKRNCEDTISVKSQIFHFNQKVNYWMNKSGNKLSADKQSALVKQEQSATESYYEKISSPSKSIKTRNQLKLADVDSYVERVFSSVKKPKQRLIKSKTTDDKAGKVASVSLDETVILKEKLEESKLRVKKPIRCRCG